MKCVKTLSEMKENMETLDLYLSKKAEPTYSFALARIKQGVCFVVTDTEDGPHFYPSRFIGYVHNSMSTHEANERKDGKETNPAISTILNHKPTVDAQLEAAYLAYCEQLGFYANTKGTFGVQRKFWRV